MRIKEIFLPAQQTANTYTSSNIGGGTGAKAGFDFTGADDEDGQLPKKTAGGKPALDFT